jgi:hypothetical protein
MDVGQILVIAGRLTSNLNPNKQDASSYPCSPPFPVFFTIVVNLRVESLRLYQFFSMILSLASII